MTIAAAVSQEIIALIFGDAHATPMPANFELGLSSTAPAAGGTGITEPTVGAYARILAIANSTANWAPTAGSAKNQTTQTFPVATATWGTLAYWVLFNAADHSYFCSGQLTDTVTVNTGDQPDFPPNSLVISEV